MDSSSSFLPLSKLVFFVIKEKEKEVLVKLLLSSGSLTAVRSCLSQCSGRQTEILQISDTLWMRRSCNNPRTGGRTGWVPLDGWTVVI